MGFHQALIKTREAPFCMCVCARVCVYFMSGLIEMCERLHNEKTVTTPIHPHVYTHTRTHTHTHTVPCLSVCPL